MKGLGGVLVVLQFYRIFNFFPDSGVGLLCDTEEN
jgi:hypothetical protein